MWMGGAIDGTHTSSDIVLKNDQNNKHDILFDKKTTFNLFLIDFKQHRNIKCLPLIEISNQNV